MSSYARFALLRAEGLAPKVHENALAEIDRLLAVAGAAKEVNAAADNRVPAAELMGALLKLRTALAALEEK
jgi:hypothetical protein